MVNPLKSDPSRTGMLRRRWIAAFNARFRAFQERIYKLVVVEDVFGWKIPEPYRLLTSNYDPEQKRVPAGSSDGGQWTRGARFGSVAEAESHIVSTGLAGSAQLTGLTPEEAEGVVDGLEKGLKAGSIKFKLRLIRVGEQEAGGVGQIIEPIGFGYLNGEILIGAEGIKDARAHDPERVKKMFEAESIGKRNFVAQDAKNTREYFEIAIAHESGHHVDTALLLDKPQAVRTIGSSPTEDEIAGLSGYATHNPSERFAETHAAMSTGRSHLVPEKIKRLYEETLKTADPEPIKVFIRNELTVNREYSSTQVNVVESKAVAILKSLQSSLDQDDVEKIEDEPHITVRFGLHDLEPERAAKIIAQHDPILAILGGLSLFRNDDFDVLKLDIESPALEALNAHLGILPNTQTHADYHPHLTVAYLKPGTGAKYVGPSGLEGVRLRFDRVKYSNKEYEEFWLPLRGVTLNADCGTGAGGFKPGNTCARGGGSRLELVSETLKEFYDNGYAIGNRVNLPTHIVKRFQIRNLEDAWKPPQSFLESIKRDGIKTPLEMGYNKETKRFSLLEGHHRLTAAIEAGLAELPVRVVVGNFKKGYQLEPGEEILLKLLESIPDTKIVANSSWRFLTSPQKLEEFKLWLKQNIALTILAKTAGQSDDAWLKEYIERAYAKGMERAFDDTHKYSSLTDKLDFYRGTKQEFLRSSFGRPVSVERVKLLAARSFDNLEAITTQMSNSISQELVDGMIKGLSPRDVARNISKRVDVSRQRALVIAQTETLRAHNEAALDALEYLGVEEINVLVEWDTAKDSRVCELCRPLQGILLKVKEAHGMFPRHPRCRCVPIPANLGESTKGQLRTKDRITAAIERSLLAERPKKSKAGIGQLRKQSRWVGASKKIAQKRPRSLV